MTLSPKLVLLGLVVFPSALFASPAGAELAKWDQTRVTEIAQQLAKAAGMLAAATASDEVLSIIKRFKQGAGFADIRENSGFGEKKLRNIIYRLNKTGRIKRISRGRYTVV